MTNQSVSDVLELSGRHYAALEAEADSAAWTDLHEMAAMQTEILHAIYRALAGMFGRGNPPEQLRLPRPHDPHPGEIRVTAGQLAAMLGGRRRGR